MPPTRKVKDDTKQCTLSFGGGVLSPSAKTLHDSKQPRITNLLGGGAGAGEPGLRDTQQGGEAPRRQQGAATEPRSKLQLSRREQAVCDAPGGVDGQVRDARRATRALAVLCSARAAVLARFVIRATDAAAPPARARCTPSGGGRAAAGRG